MGRGTVRRLSWELGRPYSAPLFRQVLSAQVFAVLEGTDGRTDRVPLFRLGPGDWAFPGPDTSSHFLLVALEEETRLIATPFGDGAAQAASDGSLGAFRYGLETWLEKLTEAVADPGRPEGTPLSSPGTVELAPGAVVWPARRFTWLTSPDGRPGFTLFGDAPLDGASDNEVLPLPPPAWLQAGRAATIDVVSPSDALGGRAWWPGVLSYERAVLTRLAAMVSARREAEREVFERRSQADDELRDRLYRRLAAVVDPPAGADFVTAEPPAGIPAALALVAAASGVQLRQPRRSSAAEGLDQIDAVARASGVRWRRVTLEGRWWRQDLGSMLAQRAADEQPVALLSRRPGVYEVIDPHAQSRRRVDVAVASTLAAEAVSLYRPLPTKALSGRDVMRFAVRSAGRDLWRFLACAVVVGALSLATPLATKAIFSSVVPQRETGMLVWIIALLIALGVCSFAFNFVTQLALARVSGSVASELQSAIWDRVLDLPVSFFRSYAPGALAMKVMAIDRIQQLATTVVAASVVAVPVGVFNLALGFWLSPRLALFGSVVIVVGVIVMVLLTRAQSRHVASMTEAGQSSFGVAMSLVDGVGKLRVAHAENRAFVQWGDPFAAMKAAFVRSQRGFAAVTTFTASGTAVGTLVLFLGAATLAHGSLTAATFIAFNTAFGQASAATLGLSGVAAFFVQAKPLYQSARPALEAEREVAEVKADPGRLTGALEVNHVTLRYTADAPAVLDDVSFSLEPGHFLAIVGPSGAGKSSLIRILLGFESPELGSVRYQGNDLENLDVRAVRRQIGVVTQSVRLLPGDIYRNIVGTRSLTMDDAWEAAEIAGIADDIRAMPMQMHTFVAEGASTFSGGQRQRLLIARAVAAKPRLLFFDEATSALDNRTQAQVAQAIARLQATRVVIAHRLSTVRHADRILVLRDGRVVQDGTFDQLVAQPGDFADLAHRQLT
jgi:NHLM bacteriocin system ABC transporter ATP-binding protein